MKTKIKVHKYRREDGTPVKTHTRKIDVDVFKPEQNQNNFENKDNSPSINIDKGLVQSKKINNWQKIDETKNKIENIKEDISLLREDKKSLPKEKREYIDIEIDDLKNELSQEKATLTFLKNN